MAIPTRPIRFFCKLCGKELWEDLDYRDIKSDTIEEILAMLTCSDCILVQLKEVEK